MFSTKPREAMPVLVLCGLEGSGKTCFARYMLTQTITEHVPTLRNRIDLVSFVDSATKRNVPVKLIDCSGDKVWGRRWEVVLASGMLFFVDGANRDALAECKRELASAIQMARKRNIRCAVILNKSDLVTFYPHNDLVRELQLEAYTSEEEEDDSDASVRVFECSVYQNNAGFINAMEWVIYK